MVSSRHCTAVRIESSPANQDESIMDRIGVARSLEQVASQAVEIARRLGADQAESGASYDEGLSVTVRMGELESVERQRDRGLAVTVYRDAKKGSASTTDF